MQAQTVPDAIGVIDSSRFWLPGNPEHGYYSSQVRVHPGNPVQMTGNDPG
jgi:hypothetical protein